MLIAVPAAVPRILNESAGGLILLDGDVSTVQCQSTPTRPASTITWKIRSSVLSDTNTIEVPEAGGLVSVISTLSLVAQQSFSDADIICQSKINDQSGAAPETTKLLKVWCKYVQSKHLAHLSQRFICKLIIYHWLWHQTFFFIFHYSITYQDDHVRQSGSTKFKFSHQKPHFYYN